jgi:hypothetical protein
MFLGNGSDLPVSEFFDVPADGGGTICFCAHHAKTNVRTRAHAAMFPIWTQKLNGGWMNGKRFVIVLALLALLAGGWILLGIPNF